ncbi:hypothetical protein SAMN05444000_1164 [Shimia gijangensis]|uniref:Uncharacterized protein n=1 Tax=Shimia gijangensis TaxID=1470563 RepID=A0A1M6NI11_9RHOB|nr:hypothetical protein SAMN05444000_1164 [Shimia gijangensis]
MIIEQSLFPLLASVGCSVFLTHGIVRWRNAREGSTNLAPEFSFQDTGQDTGLSALASLFSNAPIDLGHGRTELRPAWSLRLLAPLVAFFILAITDLSPIWNALGLHSTMVHLCIYTGVGMVLGHIWFTLLFVQRVVFDDAYVTCQGIGLRRRTRRLDDLTGVHWPNRRAASVLTFAEQEDLHIPRFLSHQDFFVKVMEDIAETNMNNGAIHPLPRWQERLSA